MTGDSAELLEDDTDGYVGDEKRCGQSHNGLIGTYNSCPPAARRRRPVGES